MDHWEENSGKIWKSLAAICSSSVSSVQNILAIRALNHHKWPGAIKGQRVLAHVLLILPRSKFHSILLYGQPFLCVFHQVMWRHRECSPAQVGWEATKRSDWSGSYNADRTRLIRFLGSCQFETNALNDTNMTLNIIRSKVPLTCTCHTKFQSILLCGHPLVSYRPFWDQCSE